MRKEIPFEEARQIVMDAVKPMETERIPLEEAFGRVLAENVTAERDVPDFRRSPYDGYAFRSADVKDAAEENPVTLRILEEVPAGSVPNFEVTEGTCTKVLTGAPIPEGADCVQMFEKTEFTDREIKVFGPLKAEENVIAIGEDVKKGTLLAKAGTVIELGLLGVLGGQNISEPLVFRCPTVGILSTGSELIEVGDEEVPGKIRNTNRYTIQAALESLGCYVVQLGTVGDDSDKIAELMRSGLEDCDAIVTTGGVSVGDYDLTPEAMEKAGVEIFFSGVEMKPGMACAYGVKDGKPVMALSGNPASSLVNFYAVGMPAINRLCGLDKCIPEEIPVILAEPFRKKSGIVRFLRGSLDLSDGTVKFHISKDQGNIVLSSAIGCNAMAMIPAGSGPQEAGTVLKAFMI